MTNTELWIIGGFVVLLCGSALRWFLALTIRVPTSWRNRAKGTAAAVIGFAGMYGLLDLLNWLSGQPLSSGMKMLTVFGGLVGFGLCGGFWLPGTMLLLGRVRRPFGIADEDIRAAYGARR